MRSVTELLGTTPGKVIAVHLNYPSRAAQRGRTPEQPSYFIKPSSSLSTGGPVERPAGCELLAFEGEIALIIGDPARRVTPQDGWKHVAAVTAANDLGVYDLRWADKGSNLRSKGGDGFTPVGPALISATDVDPAALRIRTWVNGDLVQDDSTSTLLFNFGRLIADLSQLITLETGDVILTGTPAGSSVIVPGDVVEVEVDGGGHSTGRLRTEVVDGTVPLAEYGAQPRVDDTQRAEAWSSDSAGRTAPQARIETPPTGGEVSIRPQAASSTSEQLPQALIDRINSVGVATLSVQLRKRGINNATIDGLKPTQPGKRLAGTARTLRFIPGREDLFDKFGGGFNAQKQAFDSLRQGEVLVIDARGETGTGTVGDILGLRAKVNGAAGIVTDGGVRDADEVTKLGIPVYHAGAHPAVLGRRHVPWEVDATIACGGTAVQPGDIIVGDNDGLVVIPPSMLEEVVNDAIEQERLETFVAERVAEGESVNGLYPPNDEWKARYATWRGENP